MKLKDYSLIMMVAAALALTGCAPQSWADKASAMATTYSKSPEFEMCLQDGGIDPIAFNQCLIRSPSRDAAWNDCATAVQRTTYEHCVFEQQARINAQERVADCEEDEFLGLPCTSD